MISLAQDQIITTLDGSIAEAAELGNLSIVPPRNDGSKRPFPPEWTTYQHQPPTKEVLDRWYSTGLTGFGIVCGKVSGNLEVLDFDERSIYAVWRNHCDCCDLTDLVDRLEGGYMEDSPNGRHLLYRCETISGNTKLAARPKLPDEIKDKYDKTKTLIETRGEGGYIVAAPSSGPVHPSGAPYTLVSGALSTIPVITPEEREALHSVARLCHQAANETHAYEEKAARAESRTQGGSIADDFESRAPWSEVLPWDVIYIRNGVTYVRRPGKNRDVSGTIGHAGKDLFHCFTSSSEFEPNKSYTKFRVYAILNHNGDGKAAAAELRRLGYGPAEYTREHKGKTPADEPHVWSDPIRFTGQDLPEITTDLLPGVYKIFAQQVVAATQTPPALAVFQCLGVLAAVLQKRFVVSPKQGYREPLALWLLVFLDPGTRKTAVQMFYKQPLVDWEKEQEQKLEMEVIKVKHEREHIDNQIQRLKTDAQKNGTSMDWVVNEVMNLEEQKPKFVSIPRILADDATPETMQNIMAANEERMAVFTDEAGAFEVMSGMYTKGNANVNIYLQSHAGSAVRVDRGNRSVSMDSPALTMCMAIQPSVLVQLGNKQGWRGNGFLARPLYAIPESTVGHRDPRCTAVVDDVVAAKYKDSVLGLLGIEPQEDSNGNESPRVIGLAPEALEHWYTFAEWVEARQGTNGEFYPIQDWTSKLPGAALRIAGLLEVARSGETTKTISAKTMEKTLDFCEALIPHAQAAFGAMGADQAVDDAKHILDCLKTTGPIEEIKQSELYRQHHGRFTKVDDMKPAIGVLVNRNYLHGPIEVYTGKRTSIIYKVNPALYSGGF